MKTSRHTDARGLALNVKCYNLTANVPADAEGTDAQQMRAQEDTARAWWHGAELIAQRHGFRKVWSTGRMGGWLYTEPMPEEQEDGEPGEYPPAFVAELSELLKRAPEMYADALAEIIADDASEAEEQAHRDALPARLAAALAAVLPVARGNVLRPELEKEAGGALADYLDMLLDAECHRDLTEAEAAIVADARAPGGAA